MTKAEKIFNSTFSVCERNVKIWGFEINPNGRPVGFTSLSCDCTLCKRTFNDIQKIINSKKKIIELDRKLQVISEERYKEKMFVLDMVQVTLENNIDEYKKLELI